MAIHDRAAGPALIEYLVPLTLDLTDGRPATRVLNELLLAYPERRAVLFREVIGLLRNPPERSSFHFAEELLIGHADDSESCLRMLILIQAKGAIDKRIERHLLRHDEKVIPLVREMLLEADEKQVLRFVMLLEDTFDVPFDVVVDLTRLRKERGARLTGDSRKMLTYWCRQPSTTLRLRVRAFLLLRSDPDARVAVLNEMRKDAVAAPGFTEFAAKTLEDETLDPKVRFTLIRVAGHLPLESRASLLPHLIAALAHEDAALRQMAEEILGTLGPAAREAVPALAKGLTDEGKWVPETCANALGNIGPAAKSAIPALSKAADSKDERLAAAAKEALAKIRRE